MIAPAVLASFPGLADLGAVHRRALAEVCDRRTFQPGEVLIRKGAEDADLLFVLSGEVRVAIRDDVPDAVKTVGAGTILGLVSMLDARPRSATCTALSAVECAVLPGSLARRMADAEGPVWDALHVAMARQLVRDARELSAMLLKTLSGPPPS